MPAIQPALNNATSTIDENNGLVSTFIIVMIVVTLGGIALLGGIFTLLSICVSNCSDRKKKKSGTEQNQTPTVEEQGEEWGRQVLGETGQRIHTLDTSAIDHATRRYKQFVDVKARWTKKIGWDKDEVELQDLTKKGVVIGSGVEEERGELSSVRRDSLSLSLGGHGGDTGRQKIEEWMTV